MATPSVSKDSRPAFTFGNPSPKKKIGHGIISTRIRTVLKTKLYFVRQNGPNAFVVRGEQPSDKFRVLIGPQSCTCRKRAPCVHTLFVMIRVLRVPKAAPLLRSETLKNYEVDAIMQAFWSRVNQTRSVVTRSPAAASSSSVQRHDATVNDECPICLNRLLPCGDGGLTWCRDGCGNNIHSHCMRIFVEERLDHLESVFCPLCRHPWDVNDVVVRDTHTGTEEWTPAASRVNRKLLDVLDRAEGKGCEQMFQSLAPSSSDETGDISDSKGTNVSSSPPSGSAGIEAGVGKGKGKEGLASDGDSRGGGGGEQLHCVDQPQPNQATLVGCDGEEVASQGSSPTSNTEQDTHRLLSPTKPPSRTYASQRGDELANEESAPALLSIAEIRDELECPVAEKLTLAVKNRHLQLYERISHVFGEKIFRCLLSKEWNYRVAGVHAADQLLTKLAASQVSRDVFESYAELCKFAFSDKVIQVYHAAVPLLKTLLELYSDHLDPTFVKSKLRPLFPICVDRACLGQNRVVKEFKDLVLFLGHRRQVGPGVMFRYLVDTSTVLTPRITWKCTCGRLRLLVLFLNTFREKDVMTGLRLESLLEYVQPSLAHQIPDVQTEAQKVVAEAHRCAPNRTARFVERQPEPVKTALQKLIKEIPESEVVEAGLGDKKCSWADNALCVDNLSCLDSYENAFIGSMSASSSDDEEEVSVVVDGRRPSDDDSLRGYVNASHTTATPTTATEMATDSALNPTLAAATAATTLRIESGALGIADEEVAESIAVEQSILHQQQAPDQLQPPAQSRQPAPTAERGAQELSPLAVRRGCGGVSALEIQSPSSPEGPEGGGCAGGDAGLPVSTRSEKSVEFNPNVEKFRIGPSPSSSGSSAATTPRSPSNSSSECYWTIDTNEISVQGCVGVGAVGKVYRGWWLGTEVAIKKIVDEGDAPPTWKMIKSFEQEISLMAQLRHPNIVLFMGACSEGHQLSIVTEYLPRGSLFDALREVERKGESFTILKALEIALDIARGMNYIHSPSRWKPVLIHRDLKSKNILVDEYWRAKVGDFGVSTLNPEPTTVTGTPQWMAPEILRNENYNESCDVYSFGVILWELVTQQQPWQGVHPMQVVGAVGYGGQRLPLDECPECAQSLVGVCWEEEPSKRPSFGAIVSELTVLIEEAKAAETSPVR